MANPQPDKFTKLSNELYDELIKLRIPGEARQVLDFIIRKTYGFNKTWDIISLSQFSKATRLPVSSVCRALKKLSIMNLTDKKVSSDSIKYRLQKDYEKWKPLTKKSDLPSRKLPTDKKVKKPLTKRSDTKDILKDICTKDIKKPPTESDKVERFEKAWLEYDGSDYRILDLAKEHIKARNWVKTNPAKKHYSRFITNWLNRALDRPTVPVVKKHKPLTFEDLK